MEKIIQEVILHPNLLGAITKLIIRKLKLGSYKQRIQLGAVERPHYGYCIYQGAVLAKKLGYKRISVLELGVAGGRGLLNIEYHSEQIEKIFSIGIDVYGFDTAEGLPKPVDYRDLPYYFQRGEYVMDVKKLVDKMKKAVLVLGDVRDTMESFFQEYNPAPIAAVMFDLDYYSSTVAALKMFDASEKYFLPRVFCYFDDVIGSEQELYNDYTGERLAINEFNQPHQTKKLVQPYYLLERYEKWCHQIWVFHDFKHRQYDTFIDIEDKQIPIR